MPQLRGGENPTGWVGAEPSSKQQSKQPRDACGNMTVTPKGPLVPVVLSTRPWGSVTAPRSLWSCLHLRDHTSPCLHTHDSPHPHPHLCPRSPRLPPRDPPVPTPALQGHLWFWHPRAGVSKHECSARRVTAPQLLGTHAPALPAQKPLEAGKLGEPWQSPSISVPDQLRALYQHQAHTALVMLLFL